MRLRRGEIDRDLCRLHEMADEDDVDVGEKVEEALDHEDRQRDRHPMRRRVAARTGRHRLFHATRQRDELADRGEIGRGDDASPSP